MFRTCAPLQVEFVAGHGRCGRGLTAGAEVNFFTFHSREYFLLAGALIRSFDFFIFVFGCACVCVCDGLSREASRWD